MSIAPKRPDRAALLEHFEQLDPEWTKSVISTNAAGYVARAREWGLLEDGMEDGRYVPTEIGLTLFGAAR